MSSFFGQKHQTPHCNCVHYSFVTVKTAAAVNLPHLLGWAELVTASEQTG